MSKAAVKLEPEFVSVREAGEILGIGLSNAYNLIRANKLQIVKFGRRTLVDVSSVRQLAGKIRSNGGMSTDGLK